MSCIIPILNINIDDCVGDSVGKHNYNALLLDTTICNLSSALFNENNISTIFEDLSSIILSFEDLIPKFTESKANEITLNSATTTALSSFWNKHEFSIQYLINASVFNGEGVIDIITNNNIINNACQQVPNTDILKINSTQGISLSSVIQRSKSICLSHLNQFYNPNFTNLYTENTIVNVIVEIYNYTPNPSDANHLIVNKTTPNVFNYNDRFITTTFTRDNIKVLTNIILKFQLRNKKWVYLGILNDLCT